MNIVRSIIKEAINEAFLGEMAVDFMHVGPNIGLVKEVSGKEAQLILFDFVTKQCVGLISIKKTSPRQYTVVNAASEKGYGPLVYEIAMMDVYPMGLTPDRNGHITPKAFDVWKVFHDSRRDITKKQIVPGDVEYSDRYIYDNESQPIVLNCLYYRTPSLFYQKLLGKGEEFSKKHNISSQEILNISNEFFKNKYSSR